MKSTELLDIECDTCGLTDWRKVSSSGPGFWAFKCRNCGTVTEIDADMSDIDEE